MPPGGDAKMDILDALSISSLRALIDRNRLEVTDRRSRHPMLMCLNRHYSSAEALLLDLDHKVLRDLCDVQGMKNEGSRLQLINDLVSQFDVSNEGGVHRQKAAFVNPATSIHEFGNQIKTYTSTTQEMGFVRDKDSRQGTPSKSALWYLFVMPGLVLTWVEYMFPSRGRYLASARHKNSMLIHIFFSIVFWIFAVQILFGLFLSGSSTNGFTERGGGYGRSTSGYRGPTTSFTIQSNETASEAAARR